MGRAGELGGDPRDAGAGDAGAPAGGLPLGVLRSALETMLDPFVVMAPVRTDDGVIVDFAWIYANPAADRYDAAHGGFVGRRLLERFPDAATFDAYVTLMATGQPFSVERTAYKHDETSGVYNLRAARVGDLVTVTWHDVSDVIETERRERLEAALTEAVDAALIATDADSRVVYWNRGAEALYGWSRADAVGRTMEEVFGPAGKRTVPPGRTTSYVAEMTLRRRDGRPVEVLARVSPRIEDGEWVGLVGVSVDVGEVRELRNRVVAAQEQFDVLSEAMVEGMYALDNDGRATYLNRAACELLGWPREELLGEPMHALTHFQRADGSAYPIDECPLTQVRRTGQTVEVGIDQFFRRDGSAFPVAYTASPLWADESRRAPRGCVVVFRDISAQIDEELRAHQALEKLGWVGRIQDALAEDRLVLFAQPVVSLRTGEVERHELLLRMRRDGEFVLPNVFLPVAEEFGLILRVDAWVIGQAARLAAAGYAVDFNLSARSVVHPDTFATIKGALAETGAPPRLLGCEITETALIADTAAAEEFVRKVSALGIRVSLDDFGSGYAGLGYLKRLAVCDLKIDAQFVTDADDDELSRHVINAVVSLARGFGLRTVAEGVERPETIDLLRDLGVDSAQGYVFGHPAPVTSVLRGSDDDRGGVHAATRRG